MSATKGPEAKKRPHKPQGASRILGAAESQFAMRGYEAVTIGAIAKKAGVSQANIIYHFKSKKGLYLTVLREARERLVGQLNIENIRGETLEEFIVNFSGAHLRALLQDQKASRLLYREILGYGLMEGKELAEKVLGHNLGCFVDALKNGGVRASIRAGVDPAAVAFLLIGMNALYVHGAKVARHMPGGDFASEAGKFHKVVIDILLNGVMDRKK